MRGFGIAVAVMVAAVAIFFEISQVTALAIGVEDAAVAVESTVNTVTNVNPEAVVGAAEAGGEAVEALADSVGKGILSIRQSLQAPAE